MTTATPHTNYLKKILVWDIPTRVFHWALAISFAGAMITQEMERLRLVHITFGYTMLGLVGFRVIWGMIGTRYARFSSFVPSPKKVFAYIRSLFSRQPMHTLGHNPIGALGIIAMLSLIIGTSVSGILLEAEIAEELFEELHEGLANGLLVVVGIHIAGVIFSSLAHKENLIGPMFSGFKTGPESQGIRHSFWWIGLLLIATMAWFWLMNLSII